MAMDVYDIMSILPTTFPLGILSSVIVEFFSASGSACIDVHSPGG